MVHQFRDLILRLSKFRSLNAKGSSVFIQIIRVQLLFQRKYFIQHNHDKYQVLHLMILKGCDRISKILLNDSKIKTVIPCNQALSIFDWFIFLLSHKPFKDIKIPQIHRILHLNSIFDRIQAILKLVLDIRYVLTLFCVFSET